MANEAVLALNKQAEDKRKDAQPSIKFKTLSDGETWKVVKIAESTISQGKFGMQAVYLLDGGEGLFKFSLNVGNPIVKEIENVKVGGKFSVTRKGKGIETRYSVGPA